MDYDKLIEQLNGYFDGKTLTRGAALDAATALSTLQAENEKLRAELEYEREHANAYYEECGQWEAENEKLQAELERVKRKRDAAVESIPHECKTCVYHTVFFNGCTLDHDCTNPDGGCSNNYDRRAYGHRQQAIVSQGKPGNADNCKRDVCTGRGSYAGTSRTPSAYVRLSWRRLPRNKSVRKVDK